MRAVGSSNLTIGRGLASHPTLLVGRGGEGVQGGRQMLRWEGGGIVQMAIVITYASTVLKAASKNQYKMPNKIPNIKLYCLQQGISKRDSGGYRGRVCTPRAQRAHDRKKLGVFATIGNTFAYTNHTTPPQRWTAYVSPHPQHKRCQCTQPQQRHMQQKGKNKVCP